MYTFMLGVVGVTIVLVWLFIRSSAVERQLPAAESAFSSLAAMQQRQEMQLAFDISHQNAAQDAITDLFLLSGYEQPPSCGVVSGSNVRFWYHNGVECVPSALQLDAQLSRFMEKRLFLALQANPHLQAPETKDIYGRRDVASFCTVADGRIVIESYPLKPLLLTFKCTMPQYKTTYACGQLALRPTMRTEVNASWPLDSATTASLMADVKKCDNDPDPTGCLEAIGRKHTDLFEMTVAAEPDGARAIVKVPTATQLPGSLTRLSLWFGVHVRRAVVSGSH
jgi:hypothetical protein